MSTEKRIGRPYRPTQPRPSGGHERLIWLDAAMADRLGAMRGPSETYSEAILRLVGMEALATQRG